MRFAVMCWAVLCAGALPAQQSSSPMLVRSIRIKLVSTSKVPLKSVDMDVITGALKSKGINLAVERRFDPSAVDKAAEMIREMYGDDGHKVRVEHTVIQIPPQSLEVAFEVIQLCMCN
jgi:hypothetical protein